MIRSIALLAALALAPPLALVPSPGHAFTQDEVLAASILPGWRADDGTHMAALSLRLAPSWKTYWRSPGDAGIPPVFDWSASQNLVSVQVLWPRPQVFDVGGMQSIGYHDALVLPLKITAIDPGQPILLRARVDLGICLEICVPASVTLAADLPARRVTPDAEDDRIHAALLARPAPGAEAGLTSLSCEIAPIADGLRLTATLHLPPLGGVETVVMEPGEAAVWVGPARMQRRADVLTATADLVDSSGAPFALDPAALRLTVLGPERAIEILGCPGP